MLTGSAVPRTGEERNPAASAGVLVPGGLAGRCHPLRSSPAPAGSGGRGEPGGAGPERETLKAFRSVPLVCFPFVYMTLYFWESRRPPYRQHPKQQGLA